MLKRFLRNLTILPRWVIIVIDLLIVNIAILVGYLIRFNFDWIFLDHFHFGWSLFVGSFSSLIFSLITKSYAGIVRYTGIEDGKRIATSSSLSFLFLSALNLVYSAYTGKYFIPYSVILAAFPISFFVLFFYRLFVKELFMYITESRSNGKRNDVLIFGAGTLGLSVMHILENRPATSYRVLGFIEDDTSKVSKKIQGIRIHHSSAFEDLVKAHPIKELIVAVNNLSPERKSQLVDLAMNHHVKVRVVPPVDRWIKGELSLNQIKEINIEDLLGREVISLANDKLKNAINGKRICITGAAGSIGSEIVRQVSFYSPASIILIDQSESALFEIDREIKSSQHTVRIYSYVADITNKERIKPIIATHRPQLIFHAAAYKHVPMMESNPSEAIMCNILGTKILADIAVDFQVEKFVMISTDKAVNPTNVMGCSKRIAEIYVQSLNNHIANSAKHNTSFVTTRFGNVLGSNGSVIPIFQKQIAQGGPVTVTHPDITRYFMTIPEACQLVLEASVMGKGGEIFIFDMGQRIRIADLAKRMIHLSGLEVNKDIDIVFTGLREGEKLFEELLHDQENTIPTHHDKILIAKVQEYSYLEVDKFIDLFHDLVDDKNELKMVALMKELVPEFKSNYSRFEILDKATA